jgi:dTDP-4-amino-4,6-dideoxygalactose transaminase
MVDLHTQYLRIKPEIDAAMQKIFDTTSFIQGAEVKEFSQNLAKYLDCKYVIPCANGTDALQIALMALELKPGDALHFCGNRRSHRIIRAETRVCRGQSAYLYAR